MLLLSLIVSLLAVTSEGARILAVFPHFGKSHFDFFEPLVRTLAERGHDVHVLSHFPRNKPLRNYTDHSLVDEKSFLPAVGGISLRMPHTDSVLTQQFRLAYFGVSNCESALKHPATQKLLQSNMEFDLLITELFNTDCFLGFAHRFNVPFIALSSCTLLPWANARVGNPDNPAYIPNLFTSLGTRMSFWERLYNTGIYVMQQALHKLLYDIPSQKIAREIFGPELPALQDIAKNTSIILVNSHFSLNYPRPLVPGIIEVGGMHLPPAPKPLPEDIEHFMNHSVHGVIYFNMGSMIKAATVHEDKLHAYLEAFSQLPQRVLWKWEEDSLPYQPENVMVRKWLPQFDILSHKAVKVYMGHGGLLGTIEAVYNGVPVLGTPIFGDQRLNMRTLVDAGMALTLDYSDITKESLLHSLRELLYNSSFRENARLKSQLFKDRQHSPLEAAVYWTEYVIRHKGAPHIRSAASDLNIFQYLLLDVIFITLSAIILCVIVLLKVFKKIFTTVQPFIKLKKKLQ